MSDDISIPRGGSARTAYTHSYRSRRNGLDIGTKRLVLAASVLGLVLLGGMGIWTLSGHRQAVGVPTVEADSRPLRIKPVNAGGMSVAGLSEPAAAGPGGGDLAPAAEKPDPQALLAQRPQSAVTPPPIEPAAPLAVTPAAAPGSSARAAVVPAVIQPLAHGPGIQVQLAAVDSEKGAASEWQRLSRKMPDELGGREMLLQKAEQGGKPVWRVRTGGFGDMGDAAQFCKRIKAKGFGCSMANF